MAYTKNIYKKHKIFYSIPFYFKNLTQKISLKKILNNKYFLLYLYLNIDPLFFFNFEKFKYYKNL